MFRYDFYGKVLPERVKFSISVPPIRIKVEEYGFDLQIALSILESQISVKIESEKEIADLFTLKNTVTEYVRLYTDTWGYLHGYSYDVEITSLSGENNVPYIIYGVDIPEITADHENRPYKQIGDILDVVWNPKYVQIRIAFADLRRAIKYTNETGMFCYRAIESLMQFFKEDEDRNNAWLKLRTVLNVSREWIDEIGKYSTLPRHGQIVHLTGQKRTDLMKRTWAIIDRFIIYAKNGEKPLDKGNYPELSMSNDS